MPTRREPTSDAGSKPSVSVPKELIDQLVKCETQGELVITRRSALTLRGLQQFPLTCTRCPAAAGDPDHCVRARRVSSEWSIFRRVCDTGADGARLRGAHDGQSVGAVGFSRTGYLLRHMITFPRRLNLGAAIIADSATGSYYTYLALHALGRGRMNRSYENAYGGPFFKSKASWLESELSFNVDRIRTPVLFVDNGELLIRNGAILDTIGAFRAAGRPFDYMGISSSSHEIQEARQIQASQEATVDWMRFWLQGVEDTDPEKVDRYYARWREQRKLYEQMRATEKRPAVSSR